MAELIDREELRERIYSRFGKTSTKVIATVEEGRIMSDWAFLEPFLNAAKTVDAEPVRHGRWILTSDDQYEYCRCSECGYDTEENWMIGSEIKYCAGCGARMDGDVP